MKKPKSDKWIAAMAARRGVKHRNQYTKPKELGLPVPEFSEISREKLRKANLGRKHSDETKKRLSDHRIEFLRKNPDKVPYKLNHKSKGRSYPEKYWKDVLINNEIDFVEQYPIGPYQLDFAFIDKKLNLEIDGDQHHLDPRVVASDRRRDVFLSERGWSTLRVKWSDYQKLNDKSKFIENLIQQIMNW